jgi:hypothetical protein
MYIPTNTPIPRNERWGRQDTVWSSMHVRSSKDKHKMPIMTHGLRVYCLD